MKVYYFGCWSDPGHHLVNQNGNYVDHTQIPWQKFDNVLCPDNRKEGTAKLHHKDGWTALAFWDYSVDQRSGSNSVFFVEALLSFETMLELSKALYPGIWKRIDFEVNLIKEKE